MHPHSGFHASDAGGCSDILDLYLPQKDWLRPVDAAADALYVCAAEYHWRQDVPYVRRYHPLFNVCGSDPRGVC